MNGHIHPAQALLLVSVHVVSEGVSCLLPRLDKGFMKRVIGLPSGHMKRSATPPIPAVQTANKRIRGGVTEESSSVMTLRELFRYQIWSDHLIQTSEFTVNPEKLAYKEA